MAFSVFKKMCFFFVAPNFFIKILRLKNFEPFLDKFFQFLLDAIEPKDKELDMDPTLIRARTSMIRDSL